MLRKSPVGLEEGNLKSTHLQKHVHTFILCVCMCVHACVFTHVLVHMPWHVYGGQRSTSGVSSFFLICGPRLSGWEMIPLSAKPSQWPRIGGKNICQTGRILAPLP